MDIFVAITGASGTLYGVRMIRAVANAGHAVTACVSDGALHTARHELGIAGDTPGATRAAIIAASGVDGVESVDPRNVAHRMASGSSGAEAMLIAPCSTATLGRVAHGTGGGVIERAAEVMLKERRPVVLLTREAPLSLVQLRNMVAVTEAGGIIHPASPGLYLGHETVEALVDSVVARALAVAGIDHGIDVRYRA